MGPKEIATDKGCSDLRVSKVSRCRESLLLIYGEDRFTTANPPARHGITGRKRRRRCQIGLKQKKQSIGRDVKIEIYEAM